MAREKYESDQTSLWICDRSSGKLTNLSHSFDLSLGGPTWLDDSTFFTTAQHQGSNRLFKFSLNTERTSILEDNYAVLSGDESRSCPMLITTKDLSTKKKEKRLYFLESSLTKPNELRALSLSKVGDGRAWTERHSFPQYQEGLSPLTTNESTNLMTFVIPVHNSPMAI